MDMAITPTIRSYAAWITIANRGKQEQPSGTDSVLRCDARQPPRFHAIERLPECLRRAFGCRQRLLSGLRIRLDPFLQLLAPDLGVSHVGRGVQSEIGAGPFVGAVALAQTAVLLLGDARYLRLVGIECRQRF